MVPKESLLPFLALSLALHASLLALPASTAGGLAREALSLPTSPTPRPPFEITWRKPILAVAKASGKHLAPMEAKAGPEKTVDTPSIEPERAAPKATTQPKNQEAAIGTPESLITVGPKYYFQRNEVERPPRILVDVNNPEMEAELQSHAAGGRLVLELWINENGMVDKTDVLESTQPEELAQLIIGKFSHSTFIPAQKAAKAVKSRLKIEVVIQPKWERLELE